jgi:hypothetical protein
MTYSKEFSSILRYYKAFVITLQAICNSITSRL